MPGLDLRFDPVTRDLVDDGAGGFELTEHADTILMHQTLCHYNECWHDEELGGRFHDLQAFQANPTLLAEDEARRCYGVLVKRGYISNLEVAVSEPRAGRVNIAVRSRDINTGQQLDQTLKSGG